MTNTMEIRAGGLEHPKVVALLSEHLQNMVAITPAGSVHALDLDGLRRPDLSFWSVWQGDELLGCGALKELTPDHGEVKSMRTAKGHLRKGAASAILQHIMTEAQRRGYRRLSLETGCTAEFFPAHRLYERHGFARCSHFGDYRDDANSVFMTKVL